ncbi:MAG: thioesterase family protein [Actinomycetota bacterium]|nr:thioesterase family protein [Actinomycetota bacterium]
MTGNELPGVLRVTEVAPGHWQAPHPEEDPEGRDIVFSGQLLAQMIMVSATAAGGAKETKSIHAVFARAGRYSAGPVELYLESMHAGRAWASDTVTARQGDQLLCRGLVLLNAVEPDLMRHQPPMPDVPGPDDGRPVGHNVIFPGAEVREVGDPSASAPDGSPVLHLWVRGPSGMGGADGRTAAHQAVVAWSQPGFIIGTAMRPHADAVDQSQAHRSVSTGVISHTAHFHEAADVSDWLLFSHVAPYAGHGRVFGHGAVWDRSGRLVSTFAQDSMARRVERALDPRRDM